MVLDEPSEEVRHNAAPTLHAPGSSFYSGAPADRELPSSSAGPRTHFQSVLLQVLT